jgi:hypothetical protein
LQVDDEDTSVVRVEDGRETLALHEGGDGGFDFGDVGGGMVACVIVRRRRPSEHNHTGDAKGKKEERDEAVGKERRTLSNDNPQLAQPSLPRVVDRPFGEVDRFLDVETVQVDRTRGLGAVVFCFVRRKVSSLSFLQPDTLPPSKVGKDGKGEGESRTDRENEPWKIHSAACLFSRSLFI